MQKKKDCINISYYERYDEVHYQIFNGIKKHFFHSILDGIVRVEMGFLKLFAERHIATNFPI